VTVRSASALSGSGVYRKFTVALVVSVCIALLVSGGSEIYFAAAELRAQLMSLHRIEAAAAAARITSFMDDILRDARAVAALPDGPELRLELQQLLRRVPAVSHVAVAGSEGREQLFVSRFELDRIDGGDQGYRHDVRKALEGSEQFGAVYFRLGTEPYMTITLPRRGGGAGAVLLDINLKSVWTIVRALRAGEAGHAYVVDRNGVLVAHPNISLVLRQENFSERPQVAAALAKVAANPDREFAGNAVPGTGDGDVPVIGAWVRVGPLDWIVFIEQPLAESKRAVDRAVGRTVALLAAGLMIAVASSLWLGQRMIAPVRALREGVERFAEGRLDHRIRVTSGDELQEVAGQLNRMAAQLREAQSTLERKVEERTRDLETANRVKAHFLAAAGHDLRQPVHALGLLLSSLRLSLDRDDLQQIARQADRAVDTLRELLDNLLDMSRLEAGIAGPTLQAFPISRLFEQAEFAYASEAATRGIELRVARIDAYVRSDPVMLGRILLNLTANAVRNTEAGRVVIGARRRGATLRVEVWDTGVGIAEQDIQTIFDQFVRLRSAMDGGGLGLGLYIVRGLADQLGHRVEVASRQGRGSVFRVHVPLVAAVASITSPVAEPRASLLGRCVLVVDDDPAVLDAMRRLLQLWGCRVLTASNAAQAVNIIADRRADAVLCDYRLGRHDGLEILKAVDAKVPRVLITGDTDAGLQAAARAAGIPTLHKPVQAGKLRSLLNNLLAAPAGESGDRA
jgi:signal transduction histidine kinase